MAKTDPMPNPESPDFRTPPDDTRHGAVPNLQPEPVEHDPGRAPIPNPQKPGDNPVTPPGRRPFPDGSELDDNGHPMSR
jgi:hypothetical protein